jgi:uncharacterized protein (UPF0332 family)
MNDPAIIDLSHHRLNKAKEALRQAELLFNNAGYDGSVNRSYYAIFNAVRSLLALISLDSTKHSGVISFFDRYYVKTNIFEKEFSHIVHSAFDVRQVTDYEDYVIPTAEQAQQQLDNAVKLVEEVEKKQKLLLQQKIPLPHVT